MRVSCAHRAGAQADAVLSGRMLSLQQSTSWLELPSLGRLRERGRHYLARDDVPRNDTLRYSEIRRSLNEHLESGKVTDKMLASQLRELEKHGLIDRRVYPVVPPKVEYTITKRGLRTIPAIEVLRKFGNEARRW